MIHAVSARDDREFPQPDTEAVAILQPEDFHLRLRAHGLVIRPNLRHVRAGEARLYGFDTGELILEAARVNVLLFLSGLAAAEASVNAGVITVVHADDVHEDHVAGLNQPVRAEVGMRMGAVS